MSRYARQQQVPVIGAASAKRLADAHVLIVGVGGLGAPVSLFLAGAGVGQITLIDPDTVSLSNLHRQILYQETDINYPKANCAKARLSALNSDIKISAISAKLSQKNVADLVAKATVVVDAADNFLASYLLSDACLKSHTPLVSASVVSTHGYVGVFCGTKAQPAPSLRAVFPVPATSNQNCTTAGVTGPSVGIIGSYQAQEVLKVIMQDPEQLLGKLLTIDAWSYQLSVVDFNTATEPSVFAEIIDFDSVSNNDILLDVRTANEFSQTTITNTAINLPLADLKQGRHKLGTSTRIVCLCSSGQRALVAANHLLKNGHINVAVTAE